MTFGSRIGALLLASAIAGLIGVAYAVLPAGLDSRANLGAYLNGNLPTSEAGDMPPLLSQTGAFTNIALRTPHPGLVPFGINSPLWSDGALKERFMGLPFDGTENSPKIGFAETGAWTFPNGTVFVKNFDLVVDERAAAINPVRRLETRILIRDASGYVRGATYQWRLDNSDADLVPTFDGENIDIVITQADNTTRTQRWLFPGPNQCVTCHNINAGMLLGPRTAQLNGDFTYPATGRTDNQLHTWHHLGMFNQAIADPPTPYARMVDVSDATATVEARVKSYQAANCGHCHQPGGIGPRFDMRFETPLLSPSAGRVPIVANSGTIGLVRRNLPTSNIFVRDASNGTNRMPPLARNVVDQRIISLYSQWDAFDVTTATANSLTQVTLNFDRPLEATSAANAANYAIGGLSVLQATPGADPSMVTLTTSAMSGNASYQVTINTVKEAASPQSPIWPNTQKTFTAPAPTVPGAPAITVRQAGNGQATFSFSPPANTGGAPITSYKVSCTPGISSASGASGPLTVTGLSNGTTYSCTVEAANSAGFGPVSPAVDVTPMPAPPDAPTGLAATAGNANAILSFTAPNDNGAPISGYTANCDAGVAGIVTGSGMQSPITVSGLANGTTYSCSVAAINAVGTGPYSAAVNVTPYLPKLLAVFSRKSHGSAGVFELPIARGIPITGSVSVEPRIIGAGHQIVFRFDSPITATGAPLTTAGFAGAAFSGNDVIVTVTGIDDGRRATVSLVNVNAAGVDATVSLGFLVGDVNHSRAVSPIDTGAVKARAGQVANTSNFFYDLNLSGGVTGADVAAVKARQDRQLSPS